MRPSKCMKKWFQEHKFVIILFVVWRLILQCVSVAAPMVISLHDGYNGPVPWANMDGIHYLRIAREGYFQFGEAFFPLYPLTIRFFAALTHLPSEWIGVFVSMTGFLAGLIILFDLVKTRSMELAKWTVVFLVTFPTAFFFSAVYTEGLFFFLIITTVAFAKRKQFLFAGVCGALASATRVIGVLLLIVVAWEYIRMKQKNRNFWKLLGVLLVPLGLFLYMYYLYHTTGDAVRFFHVQPAFGANRSGSGIILLPQVLWRYFKIIFTAVGQPTLESYIVSITEFVITLAAYTLLYYGYRIKTEFSYLWYSLLAVTLPTLTGTLSSMPRYLVTIFPLFIILGHLRGKSVKVALVIIFSLLQIIGAMLYLRGWFVA